MSSKLIHPFAFKGNVKAPYSKSYLQRAIALALLSDQPTKIIGVTYCNDVVAAIAIVKSLGAKVQKEKNAITIIPGNKGGSSQKIINTGEAGLSTRMFAPIAASLYSGVKVEGEGSILRRPMSMVIEALEQLGVKVNSADGFLPLKLSGVLQPGNFMIDGSESSQLLTGLLIALPTLNGDSIVEVNNLKSIPYIDMTLQALSDFGIIITHNDYKTFFIKGNQTPRRDVYYTEGDWSGASFLLVGAALSGNIVVENLNIKSKQADQKIITALKLAGAKVTVEGSVISVESSDLTGFNFDATHCPDLFPPLAVLGLFSKGVTTIKGATRLLNKESNRSKTIQEEIEKIGGKVILEEDEMKIYRSQITGGKVSSRNDHRIAMMLAILGCASKGDIEIENPESVLKSFPEFFELIEKMPLR